MRAFDPGDLSHCLQLAKKFHLMCILSASLAEYKRENLKNVRLLTPLLSWGFHNRTGDRKAKPPIEQVFGIGMGLGHE